MKDVEMLVDRIGLSDQQLAPLRAITARQSMLHEVVAWMGIARPTPELISVTDQDEFTNDLVVRLNEGLYLVYDCT